MITNIYSKRQKRLRGEYSDVYQYDELPIEFRRQVTLIFTDILGTQSLDIYRKCNGSKYYTNYIYDSIYNILCREYGVLSLGKGSFTYEKIFHYLQTTENIEECLDIIELLCQSSLQLIQEYGENYGKRFIDDINQAVQELNYRFKEHGIGYQFESDANEIIRVDSQFIHSEVVKPVLKLLANNDFYQGANDEFLSAHEHYRHQNYKESLNDCLKSFESFLKAIHEKRNWEYNKDKDTAQKLVQSCFDHELIPKYMQTQFDSLGNLLKSGLPTTRNRESGHGQGTEVREVPEHLASYALHLTATNLLFLAQCEVKL